MLYVKFLRLMMNESIFFADKVAKMQRIGGTKVKRRGVRAKIFYTFNFIIGIVFIISVWALNSESCIPAMVCGCSLAYLSCALYLNEALKVRRRK